MENTPSQGDLLQGQPSQTVLQPVTPQTDPTQSPLAKPIFTILSIGFTGAIILNLGIGLLMVWQTRLIRRQLSRDKEAISRFQRMEEPLVKDIVGKLESFGTQHRDFQPILQRYGIMFPRFQGATNAPAASATVPSVLQTAPASAPKR